MEAPVTDAKNALDTRRENGGVAAPSPIINEIRKMQSQFQLAMPRGQEADQLVRDAITAIRKTHKLAECESATVLGGLMTAAQLGLRVGVLGQAWLLPFNQWDPRTKKSYMQAQLIIGYQGYIELAHRAGKVRSVMPRTVHENDEFDCDYGVNGTLTHRPARGERGEPIGYHCISRYDNGGYDYTFMSQTEMLAHRDRFAMAKKNGVIVGPWKDHFEQMALKTVVRRHIKYIPKSPELYVAQFVDGGIRINPAGLAEDSTVHPAGEYIDAEAFEGDGTAFCTQDQLEEIEDLARKMALDKAATLAYVEEIIGHSIVGLPDLTEAEADKALRTMRAFHAQNGG